ncbi:MAG: GTPase Era [Actinobacteria bacterium]|nr:GTPase Era [Actinomycetota bacterium]MDC0245636.1 GTPase Era [Acidimicrobiaceae bacterium]|tara:strand:+ start:10 stop:870 length:861 start_codon:yes stop_codon:yes gene_type:complete
MIEQAEDFRSGFITLVGRPNVGKSTLLNQILGTKVTIVSDKPQTTRTEIRGVLNRDNTQAVFCDTPGIHKPRTLLGERLNATARESLPDMDVVLFLVDADGGIGKGDRRIAETLPKARTVLVLNKIDKTDKDRVLTQLSEAAGFDFEQYFPVSAKTGEGVEELVKYILEQLPEGPQYYPDEMITDNPEAFWVAELVREQLLAIVKEELPHSIATRVTEWEWPRIRCEILVERESQKGIVIGKKGLVLKEVGTKARQHLPEEVFLELFVRVDKNWQRQPRALNRLGY